MKVRPSMTQHREEVERWRQARVGRLTAPESWLSLVGRVALEEGDTVLDIGTVTLDRGIVTLAVAPGVVVTRDDISLTRLTRLAWRSDAQPERDRLWSGGRLYELIQRGQAFAVRIKDPNAEARTKFSGLRYFPIDIAYRAQAHFEAYPQPRTIKQQLPVGEQIASAPGLVRFQLGGQALSLEPTADSATGRLSFLFGDRTNVDETYGGGRFLYAAPPVDGRVVLDFNQAYNPPCAFTPYATCPAVPPANRLPLRIEAGEKSYP